MEKIEIAEQFIKEFPAGEEIVSMLVHQDKVYLATKRAVYVQVDNHFEPLELVLKDA